MFKSPSSHVVLLSWIVLALALATFQGRDSGHGRKTGILLCSVLAAVGLGFIEGTGSTSIVLTNIPWCLTFGVLVETIVSTASSGLLRRRLYVGQFTREQVGEKQEKDVF
jgi:hypothetical protein